MRAKEVIKQQIKASQPATMPDDEELPQKKHAELSLPAFLFPPELPFDPSKPHRGLMKSTLLLKVCCRWIDIYTRLT